MTNPETPHSPDREQELTCPTCGHDLVPVYTLPREKTKYLQGVEIREQFYCPACDRRYALEELGPKPTT